MTTARARRMAGAAETSFANGGQISALEPEVDFAFPGA